MKLWEYYILLIDYNYYSDILDETAETRINQNYFFRFEICDSEVQFLVQFNFNPDFNNCYNLNTYKIL